MSLRARLLCGLVPAALLCSPALSKEDEAVEGEVILTFKSSATEATASAVLKRHSLTGLHRRFDSLFRNRQRVSGMVRDHSRKTADLIQELKDDPDVEAAEPNYLRRVSAVVPNDADFSKLWGLSNSGQTVNASAGVSGVDIQYLKAWKLSRSATAADAPEVVVAVVDTGVDITHPDLAANVWTNPGETAGNNQDDDGDGYTDDVHGYDFAENTAAITDSGYHGTHVAGTIAAVGRNGLGIIGVEPHAKILPLKVSSDGDSMSTSAILSAINYVLKLKARGINIVAVNASYGGSSSTTAERTAIEALRDAGIILVAAAGNDGTNNDSRPQYPAAYTTANIITVAALDQDGTLASFSNYGSTSVDIAAPGVNVYSSSPAASTTVAGVRMSGTSWTAVPIEYSGLTDSAGITGLVVDCGIGNTAEFPASVSGNIALIQRGTLTFADKVTNAAKAGARAAIVYDNTADALSAGNWTLNTAGGWLPALHITQASGQAILVKMAAGSSTATVLNYPGTEGGYRFLDGTSMAAPHVTGAVAFAALNFPDETMAARRTRILSHATPLAGLTGKVSAGAYLNLAGIVDTDSDGLPDWWETAFPAVAASGGAGDSDGDGFTNLQEFLNRTDPDSAEDRPGFTAFAGGAGSAREDFTLSFFGAEDLQYQVEWSDSLEAGSWKALGSVLTGTGAGIQVNDPGALAAAARRFYRLKLLDD